jgi:two-component system LytT family response regulator
MWIDRIPVKIDGVFRIMRVSDVDWFEADANYIRLHLGKEAFQIRGTIAELEKQLDPRHFARIHKRYIVNLDRVVEMRPLLAGDAAIVLRDGTKLRVARTRRPAFQSRLFKAHAS